MAQNSDPSSSTSTGLTLTQATHGARLIIKYGSVALAVMIVGRIFVGAFVSYWIATHPPAPPPPTVGFGKLPLINFPLQDDEDRPSSYTLETATGTLTEFSDRAKVFFSPKSVPSLLADEQARQIAARYDFIFEPEVLDASTYRWHRNQPLDSYLEINVLNNNFELSSDYLSRPALLNDNDLPDEFAVVERVKSFLSSADLLSRDMATASATVTYSKALGSELVEAVSLSDADFIVVDLDRTPIDGAYKMYGPVAYRSSIHAVVTGALGGRDSIVELEYNFQPIDYSLVHTYPLRTSKQAWKIMQAGEGYVAQKGDLDQAVVRNVYLGYYTDVEEQEYLQPIYVFEGDQGFLGYVSAIDPSYTQISE